VVPFVRRRISLGTGKTRFGFQLCGGAIGMYAPTGANFFGSVFFTVQAGKEKLFADDALVPAEGFREKVTTRLIRRRDSATIFATQQGRAAELRVELEAVAGDDRLRMSVAAARKDAKTPIAVTLNTYPSGFTKRSGHKVVTFSSGRVVEQKYGEKRKGGAEIEPGERWLYARDVTLAKQKGAGGCAIAWHPEEIAAANVDVNYFTVRPTFTLKPNVAARFSLWDFGDLAQAQALERMKAWREN